MAKNPHAVALGRLGGLATKGVSSPAKVRASRENGRKGGRPKASSRKPPTPAGPPGQE